jgi:hypothetical protein
MEIAQKSVAIEGAASVCQKAIDLLWVGMPPMSDVDRGLATFASLAQMVATIMEVGLQPCYKSTKQGFANPAV